MSETIGKAKQAEDILTRLIAEINPGVKVLDAADLPISTVHAWYLRMKKVADEWTEQNETNP